MFLYRLSFGHCRLPSHSAMRFSLDAIGHLGWKLSQYLPPIFLSSDITSGSERKKSNTRVKCGVLKGGLFITHKIGFLKNDV